MKRTWRTPKKCLPRLLGIREALQIAAELLLSEQWSCAAGLHLQNSHLSYRINLRRCATQHRSTQDAHPGLSQDSPMSKVTSPLVSHCLTYAFPHTLTVLNITVLTLYSLIYIFSYVFFHILTYYFLSTITIDYIFFLHILSFIHIFSFLNIILTYSVGASLRLPPLGCHFSPGDQMPRQ